MALAPRAQTFECPLEDAHVVLRALALYDEVLTNPEPRYLGGRVCYLVDVLPPEDTECFCLALKRRLERCVSAHAVVA